MLPLRVYIDTSVIGGCLDEEFRDGSITFINKVKNGDIIAVISELTDIELRDAPEEVQKIIKDIPIEYIEYVELTEEALNLAQLYITNDIVG